MYTLPHVCVQVALTNALYWMATDHPYHALYPIIALSNGDTDGGDPAGKNVHIRHETNTGRVRHNLLQPTLQGTGLYRSGTVLHTCSFAFCEECL